MKLLWPQHDAIEARGIGSVWIRENQVIGIGRIRYENRKPIGGIEVRGHEQSIILAGDNTGDLHLEQVRGKDCVIGSQHRHDSG